MSNGFLVRDLRTEDRGQKSGVRSQESEVRSQESEDRSQETEDRRKVENQNAKGGGEKIGVIIYYFERC